MPEGRRCVLSKQKSGDKLPLTAPGKIQLHFPSLRPLNFSHKTSNKIIPSMFHTAGGSWTDFSGVHQVKPAQNKSSVPGSTLFRDHPLIIQSARRRNVETQDSQMFEMRQSFSCPLWKSDRETGPVMTKTSGSDNGKSNRAMTQTWSSLSQKCLNRSRTRVVRSEPTCFKLWFKVQISQALGQRTCVMTGFDLGSLCKIWT